MKLIFALIIVFLPFSILAQQRTLSGKVIDASSHLPVIYANVSGPGTSAITNYNGYFSLTGLSSKDSIRVSAIGFRVYKFAYSEAKNDTITVYLHESSIMLGNVNVKARGNYKRDSLALRKQYADVFNYKAPNFADIFSTVDPYVYTLPTYNTGDNATMIVNVNLLTLADLLTKKKAPTTKLQQTLLEDEADKYVDQHFSPSRIVEMTGLRGDSLKSFIFMYRPTVQQTKKMNDYQMGLYIKKSYQDFLKNYHPIQTLSAN
jgi:hypothetical protein